MNINHFTAKGNSVVGVEDAGLIEQGYANEPLHLVCLCYGVPGMGETGEEVAQVIAELLNSRERKLDEVRDAIGEIDRTLRIGGFGACHCCGSLPHKGHAPDCPVARLTDYIRSHRHEQIRSQGSHR